MSNLQKNAKNYRKMMVPLAAFSYQLILINPFYILLCCDDIFHQPCPFRSDQDL